MARRAGCDGVRTKLVTHLHADCEEGRPVMMSFQLDKSGQAVAFAHPEREIPTWRTTGSGVR